MKAIKLEEVPEIQIVVPDLNKTGCPISCNEEGKYLRCYYGLHYQCPKIQGSKARYEMKRDNEK